MTDLQTAKNNLSGHTICLCKDGKCLFDNKSGIAPMMSFIADGIDLRGYSVADLVVGKAVALLFVRSGITNVFAKVISESGKAVLNKYGVSVDYEVITDKIINRSGTDICPMEKAVADTEDQNEAYDLLQMTIQRLKG